MKRILLYLLALAVATALVCPVMAQTATGEKGKADVSPPTADYTKGVPKNPPKDAADKEITNLPTADSTKWAPKNPPKDTGDKEAGGLPTADSTKWAPKNPPKDTE